MKANSALTRITYGTAVSLALFSGGVSTYGLTKFAPGGEAVIAVMGVLFEAGKLTSFALLHRRLPSPLKAALLFIGLVLMALNIAGVSGFLSNAYEHQQMAAQAASHTAEAEAGAGVALVERELLAAEDEVKAAEHKRDVIVRSLASPARIAAANAILTSAIAERDALVEKMAAARSRQAKSEAATIVAGGEFAAIAFVADATGIAQGRVLVLFLFTIASLPDLLAVLLLVAAGYSDASTAPKAPKRHRSIAAKRGWMTRRLRNAKAAQLMVAK